MTVVPVMRHSAESEDFIDRVQRRSFRMMITGNSAIALLLRLFRVWRVIFLDGALPSARNSPITHIAYRFRITGKKWQSTCKLATGPFEVLENYSMVLMMLRGIINELMCELINLVISYEYICRCTS